MTAPSVATASPQAGSAPTTLDAAGIAARIPHQGRMALLHELIDWDDLRIHCVAIDHHDPHHPLRTPSGLLAPVAIEYAAQAMALHGGLGAAAGDAPTPGYIASVRAVRFHVDRLDTVAGALHVRAERQAGDARQVLYRFEVSDASGRLLAEGRATVVLNTPLPPFPLPTP